MKDIKILKRCPHCIKHLVLVDSNGTLEEKCLNCDDYPTTVLCTVAGLPKMKPVKTVKLVKKVKKVKK